MIPCVWYWYVIEESISGKRYVGITTDLGLRLAQHNQRVGSWLGSGRKETIRCGEFSGTFLQAVVQETVVFMEELAMYGDVCQGVRYVRGGPFPGLVFDREVVELQKLQKIHAEQGVGALRAKLEDIQASRVSWHFKGVADHVKIRCFRCSRFGHYRGHPDCPAEQEAALMKADEKIDAEEALRKELREQKAARKRKREEAQNARKEKRAQLMQRQVDLFFKWLKEEKARRQAEASFAEDMKRRVVRTLAARTPAIAAQPKKPKTRQYVKRGSSSKTYEAYNNSEKGKRRGEDYRKTEKCKKARAARNRAYRLRLKEQKKATTTSSRKTQKKTTATSSKIQKKKKKPQH